MRKETADITLLTKVVWLAHTPLRTLTRACKEDHKVKKQMILPILLATTPLFAKDEPRITIQVVKSQASTYQRSHMVSGRTSTSYTNCNTLGNVNGTATSYGTGTTNVNAFGNSNTNCTTTTNPGTPPHEVTRTITQEYVGALLPDGRKAVLWCQEGFRKCLSLAPGPYQAEIRGNALFIYVPELSGKERKVKYKAVMVDPTTPSAQP
jgi:hypothetical protein